MKKPSFFVDRLPIDGNLILAPMDGFSDQPFRSMIRRLGSAMSYTEFINAIDVLQGHPFLEKRLSFSEFERPVVYQFLDNDVDRLEHAIDIVLRNHKPDVIDINMGCSSKSVTHRGAGASLLKEPAKIAEIFSKLSAKLTIPVTGKIRLGWDDQSKNYLEVAKIIQESGGKLLAVHARTRKQGFTGKADWDAIAHIKQSLSIPVIGNGDVQKVTDIDHMLAHTRCDGIMIGRAVIRNPWIFSRKEIQEVSGEEIFHTFRNHLSEMCTFYGEKIGPILYRKFIAHFIDNYPLTRDEKRIILTMDDPNRLLDNLDKLIGKYHNTTRNMV